MPALIELQQVLSHSSSVDKIQQAKNDNQTVYQQLTVAELKEKDVQKQREVQETYKTENLKIKDRGKKQKKNRKNNRQKNNRESDTVDASKHPEHIIDIIV